MRLAVTAILLASFGCAAEVRVPAARGSECETDRDCLPDRGAPACGRPPFCVRGRCEALDAGATQCVDDDAG